MSLATRITEYYFVHALQLAAEKQFHLGTRLAAWTGDERAYDLLRQNQDHIVTTDAAVLADTFRELTYKKPVAAMHIPSYFERKPYFERYNSLFGLELALFRLRHLSEVYGIDGREAFAHVIPTSSLLALEKQLLSDTEAMQTLSTYAINYIYLLHSVVLLDTTLQVKQFLQLGEAMKPTTKDEMRLVAYWYTHCIIADTNFYVREVPSAHLPIYYVMLRHLEKLIDEHFNDMSLDVKLEFLVCARICSFATQLRAKIYAECEHSLSPEGDFLVDTHNTFATISPKKSFEASEHRNVLYIMSTTPFKPHTTRV